MRILITGATGFLGSHIAEFYSQMKYEVILLTRRQVEIYLSKNTKQILLDKNGIWKKTVISLKPTILIHTAWSGVQASKRDDINDQLENITFLFDLFDVLEKSGTKKIIALGSQAEYGIINKKINEEETLRPITNYGIVKCTVQKMIESFASLHKIEWYWLRIFSIYGENEGDTWLIPSTLSKIFEGEQEMNCTSGEQIYSYLYIKDFLKFINTITLSTENRSGIYNISSRKTITLKDLLNTIKKMTNPSFVFNFGQIPLREFQSMHIEGDMSKFDFNYNKIEETSIEEGLQNTINYYKSQYK